MIGLVNLTKDCDCIQPGSPIVAQDIGFAASSDPVALDQAALDLIRLTQLSCPTPRSTARSNSPTQRSLDWEPEATISWRFPFPG